MDKADASDAGLTALSSPSTGLRGVAVPPLLPVPGMGDFDRLDLGVADRVDMRVCERDVARLSASPSSSPYRKWLIRPLGCLSCEHKFVGMRRTKSNLPSARSQNQGL